MKITNLKSQISRKSKKIFGTWSLGFGASTKPATVWHLTKQGGFTWPELVVILAMVAVLFGFITINLITAQHKASVNTEAQDIVAQLRNQQTQAIVGQTEGRASSDSYGIHFNTSSYFLFHGTSYNPNPPDSSNFIVNLDPNLQFSNITFPNSNVIFSQGSGEVSGFVSNSNTVTLKDITGGEQKTITINKYGVVTQVQ